MKIYDIIKENRSVTEANIPGLGSFFAGVAKLAAKTPKTQAIEDLAQAWAGKAASEGIGSGAKVILQGEKAAKLAGISDDVILDAKLLAQKLIGQSESALGKQAAARAFGSGWDAINKWTTMLGVGVPITKCAWNINQAYAKAKAGDPAFQGDRLDKHIQLYLDECVGSILAMGIGRGVIRAGMSMPKNFFGSFYNGPALEKAFNGLTRAGQTAFTAWLLTSEGQRTLAKWTVGGSFFGTAFKEVRDYISGWVMTGYDELANAMGAPLPGYAATQQNQAKKDSSSTGDVGNFEMPKSMFNPVHGGALK